MLNSLQTVYVLVTEKLAYIHMLSAFQKVLIYAYGDVERFLVLGNCQPI